MDVNQLLTDVDDLKAQIEAVRPLSAEQETRILQKFRLDWNYHSNAIEGNSLTYGETRAFLLHGLTASGKPFKDYLDIKGHNEVLDVLSDVARQQEELTESAIRELHKILLVERYQSDAVTADGIRTKRWIEVGTYKTAPNHVVTATGQTHFFATPEETPAKMAELVDWYRAARDAGELHPVILAATFHYRFVSIHPFDDGNGRMARILMNLILMQFGYLPVVLKQEHKGDYFLALQRADAGDLSDFIALIAQNLMASEELYLRAARGEAIDELGDFDKKLRLLRQAIETPSNSQEDQWTLETQQFIISGFLSTYFEAVGKRFTHLDPLFGKTELHIFYQTGVHSQVIEYQPIQQLVEKLQKVSSNGWPISLVKLFYYAQGFVKDSTKNFLFNSTTYFNPTDFAITLQVTGTRKQEIFRAAYSSLPSETEGEQIAGTALEALFASFEKMASSTT